MMGPVEKALQETAYIAAEAVGIAVDDPDHPNVAVAVHDGQVVYLGISNPMLQIGPAQLTDVVNATILNAFAMWKAHFTGAVK